MTASPAPQQTGTSDASASDKKVSEPMTPDRTWDVHPYRTIADMTPYVRQTPAY